MNTSSYSSFAGVYDLLTFNASYDVMAARLCDILRSHGIEGGLVLDLGCGTGTLTYMLSERGYDMLGVDSSPDMLTLAQCKECLGARPLFLCQSMEELDLYGTVRAAVSTLDCFNHLPGADALDRAFSRLRLFVEPGGLLVFDVNTQYKHKSILANETYIYDLDDVYCVWQNATDGDSLVTDISLEVFQRCGDSTYTRFSESFSERAFSDECITGMLAKHGFSVLSRENAYTGIALSEHSQRALYTAVRGDGD